MLKAASLKLPELPNVQVAFTPQGLELSGTITSKEPDRSLGAFFRAVHEANLAEGLQEFRVDVRGLSFVNSSALRLFIDWTIWVARPGAATYKLRFVRNSRITWQRVSFSAIAQLAAEHVVIEDGA